MIWLAAAVVQLLGADLPPRPPPGPLQTIKPGLYETLAPDTGLPAGPLDKPPSGVLSEWLEVSVSGGNHLGIVFQPDGRVRWEMPLGPQGPIAKTTFVDGLAFTTSTFSYGDCPGAHCACPREKRVSGPGLSKEIVEAYRCDSAGRIVARGDAERIERTPGARGYVVRHGVGPSTTFWSEVRRDDGRLERAFTGADEAKAALAFAIVRDGRGVPQKLVRTLGGTQADVPSGNPPDARVAAAALGELVREGPAGPVRAVAGLPARLHGPMPRWLVHAFLGAPTTTSDDGQGLARVLRDDWSDGCWLNQISTLAFDAALVLVGAHAGCICGLCVADDVPLAGEGILGVDTHIRTGPWVALDGVVVTADHPVLTPVGALPAGWLDVGAVVLGPAGPRTLVTFERLPDGPRRGRNLRTTSGVFEAGGFLFLSEESLACPAGSPAKALTRDVGPSRASPGGAPPAFVP